jgi:pyruvate, orthophosphate dikinase
VVPEVMIPLVSAKREVELVKRRIDAVAARVRSETGVDFAYRLGVMVETPRAALRAHEIAHHAAFLSFGTNDLTQMTYGLSRDDAGRFMGAYVQQGVFHEDPFHRLDIDGVGELLQDRGGARAADAIRTSCSRSAASTAATPIPSTSAGGGLRLRVLLALPGARGAACRRASRDPGPEVSA